MIKIQNTNKIMLSLFNVVKSEGDKTWVYNTLSSAFIEISTQAWNSLSSSNDRELLDTLKRQGIIVDDNQTEINKYRYIYYKKLFDNRTLSVTIAPTMQCNFGCPYCFEGTHKTMPKMQEEVIAALTTFLIKHSEDKKLSINWFGGEPLLAFDVICRICDTLNEHNVEFTSSMVTNGSLLTEDKTDHLDSLHLNHLQITLDGTAESHDKRRFYKGGLPSFNNIIANIDCLIRKTSIPLVIQVGVDNTNLHAYEDVYEYVSNRYKEALEKKRIIVGCNNIQNRTGFDCTGTCLTDRQLYDKRVRATEDGLYPELMAKLPGMSLPCMYRRTNQPAIDPQGNIYHCLEHLGMTGKSIGNICKGTMSFSKIADMAFMGDPFDDNECRQCNVLPVCGGGCPQDILACNDRKHKTYCSYHKQFLADMLPYLYKRFIKEQ